MEFGQVSSFNTRSACCGVAGKPKSGKSDWPRPKQPPRANAWLDAPGSPRVRRGWGRLLPPGMCSDPSPPSAQARWSKSAWHALAGCADPKRRSARPPARCMCARLVNTQPFGPSNARRPARSGRLPSRMSRIFWPELERSQPEFKDIPPTLAGTWPRSCQNLADSCRNRPKLAEIEP